VGTSLKREACLIDGIWVAPNNDIEVINPADGARVGSVPKLTSERVEQAIDAAAKALPIWTAYTAKDRADILKKFFSLMVAYADELATILTDEQGKPLGEARNEILYAASFVEWFSEEARRTYGEVIPSNEAGRRAVVIKQPIGVVAAITPWNFPAAMVTRKIAPALAAGCSVVLKPAHQTPFTALALGALAQEAGLPPGVLNIVTGDAIEIGGILTASPVIRKLSFTGSTRVGAALYSQSAPTIKKLSLELGGNAPLIIFDDADILEAVNGAMASKFRNAGQTCVCANRIYVQKGVYKNFVNALAGQVKSTRVGPGMAPDTDIGPLIDTHALEKVSAHIADAIEKGARIEVGGQPHALGGQFFEPTIITGVSDDMLVVEEETFGPLAPIIMFDTEDEVIRRANATPYGLAAYVFTNDLSRAWRMFERIEVGMIGINTGVISTEVAPFGGIKSSGLGREGGRQGIDDYLEIKYGSFAMQMTPRGE